MSFWAKVGVVITDLDEFKRSCQKHNVEYTEKSTGSMQGMPIHAILKDKEGRSSAYLCEDVKGYRMVIDNDRGYSSISNRLGRNGGKLMRDYTQGVVEKNISRSGGFISQRQEQPDGSVILKVAVGM